MANPQIENGHVDIANEIVEALAKIRISGEQMQCLWVILRKTYGWHKKEDSISLSQFQEMTSLKKPRICRCINELLSKKVILVTNNGNGIATYRFNKDFDSWLSLPKKVTLPKMVKGRYHFGDIQKKTIQKKEECTKMLSITNNGNDIKKKKVRSVPMADEEFWKEMRGLFTWVDIDREITKMRAYMLTPKGRRWKMTQQRVVEWLGRIDKPIGTQNGKSW